MAPAKTQRRKVDLRFIFLLCAVAPLRETKSLLLQRVLDCFLRVFRIDLAVLCRLRVVGCWSKCVRALTGRKTLRGLFRLRVQRLVDLDVQRNDGIAVGIGLLGSLKQLKIDGPGYDLS